MILRKVLLIVDPSVKMKGIQDFDYRARSIGFFLGKSLATKKFDMGCQQLVFGVTNNANFVSSESYGSQSLLVRVRFDPQDYFVVARAGDEESINKYFDSLIRVGAETVRLQSQDLYAALIQGLDDFSTQKYLNEWIFVKKTIENSQFIEVKCQLDSHRFRMFVVIRSGAALEVDTRELVETKPDELHYHQLLGKVTVEERKLSLFSRSGKLVKSISI